MDKQRNYDDDSIRCALCEYLAALGHWGWAVVGDIGLGVIGAILDVTHAAPFPVWAWLPLILIGLVIPPFIAFYKLRLGRNKLGREITARPDVTIAIALPQADNIVRLRVQNRGSNGDFKAKAKLLTHNHPSGAEWFIRWQGSYSQEQNIHGMADHCLEIASCEWTENAGFPREPPKRFIRFHTPKTVGLARSVMDVEEHEVPSYYHSLEPGIELVEYRSINYRRSRSAFPISQ